MGGRRPNRRARARPRPAATGRADRGGLPAAPPRPAPSSPPRRHRQSASFSGRGRSCYPLSVGTHAERYVAQRDAPRSNRGATGRSPGPLCPLPAAPSGSQRLLGGVTPFLFPGEPQRTGLPVANRTPGTR
ncbi:uncharacterized protein LOC143443252 [Arvicanthis niloticus]|uniref:uncharacterized protein LOC143313471 n=1 Tax=Arvicanthis niloticus TaxID=61156 RepID=UPI00402B67F3